MLKNKFNITVFFIFFIIGIVGVFHHEIWRDEGQVWLVVRDLNLAGIFDHVRVEGHPLLWYLLVLPFAKLKLSVISMQILSFCFMTAATGIFLWFAPFSKLSKICVLFSAGVVYSLTIISRSYSLIPLFVFLLAIFYEKQKKHPYIYSFLNILLANTHVLMFGFCTAVATLFGYENIIQNKIERKKYITPFLLMAFSLISVVLYVFSSPLKNISVNIQPVSTITFNKVFTNITIFFANLYPNNKFIFVIAGICIVMGMILILVENKKIFITITTGLIFQFYIYLCVYQTSNEKAALALIILLYAYWVIAEQKDFSGFKAIFMNLLIVITFGLSWQLSYLLLKNDYLYNYSGSKEAAKFIENKIEKDAVLISTNELTTAGIIAYLPKERKFYTHLYDDYYTYAYAKKFVNTEPFKFEKPEKLKDKKVYYLYSALGIPKTDKQIIFASNPNTLVVTEYFFIIKDGI